MTNFVENFIFGHRRLLIAFFTLMTVFMVFQASHLKIDAGFAKLLPLEHPYIQTYIEHRDAFGGANRVVIAIRNPNGDIFTPEFFQVLQELTDDVFFIPGVDRGRVMSLVALLGANPGAILASDQPSPGEARKVGLALGLGTPKWLLVLDEPTNHLDLPSIERLEEALSGYEGALLLITHDEALADEVADTRWNIGNTGVGA